MRLEKQSPQSNNELRVDGEAVRWRWRKSSWEIRRVEITDYRQPFSEIKFSFEILLPSSVALAVVTENCGDPHFRSQSWRITPKPQFISTN